METSLFRERVFEHQRAAFKGDLIVAQPTEHWVLTALFFMIVVAAAVYLSWGSYHRRESVRGYLVPDRGVVKVRGPHGSSVLERHVGEGDVVAKGDLLFTLSGARASAAGELSHVRVLNALAEQRRILETSVSRTERSTAVRSNRLRQRQERLRREIEHLQSLRKGHQGKLRLSQESLRGAERALAEAPGVISQDELRNRAASVLEGDLRLEELEMSLVAKEGELADTAFELRELELEQAAAEARLRRDLSELEVMRSEEGSVSILAPVAGRVSAVRAAVGQTVAPPTPLCVIVPENAQLEAEVYVPTRAAGWVKPGQAVSLMYDAFPHEHYGVEHATVHTVEKTILNPSEVDAPIPLQEPVYPARLRLEQEALDAFGERYELQPGMLLTGHVMLEQRSLWRWLLRPLFALSQ